MRGGGRRVPEAGGLGVPAGARGRDRPPTAQGGETTTHQGEGARTEQPDRESQLLAHAAVLVAGHRLVQAGRQRAVTGLETAPQVTGAAACRRVRPLTARVGVRPIGLCFRGAVILGGLSRLRRRRLGLGAHIASGFTVRQVGLPRGLCWLCRLLRRLE